MKNLSKKELTAIDGGADSPPKGIIVICFPPPYPGPCFPTDDPF